MNYDFGNFRVCYFNWNYYLIDSRHSKWKTAVRLNEHPNGIFGTSNEIKKGQRNEYKNTKFICIYERFWSKTIAVASLYQLQCSFFLYNSFYLFFLSVHLRIGWIELNWMNGSARLLVSPYPMFSTSLFIASFCHWLYTAQCVSINSIEWKKTYAVCKCICVLHAREWTNVRLNALKMCA